MSSDDQLPAEPVAAYDDPTTAAHERRKSRAFAGAVAGGLLLAAVGIFLATKGSWGVLVGSVLFIVGGAFSFAAVVGFYFRHRARRTLSGHPWLELPVQIVGMPPAGARGKIVVQIPGEPPRQVAITGATSDLAHAIKKAGHLEYAGDLGGSGMLFVRALDGDEVFVATIRSR